MGFDQRSFDISITSSGSFQLGLPEKLIGQYGFVFNCMFYRLG
jgi:hypothetical protein